MITSQALLKGRGVRSKECRYAIATIIMSISLLGCIIYHSQHNKRNPQDLPQVGKY